jgi:hypothetical protein
MSNGSVLSKVFDIYQHASDQVPSAAAAAIATPPIQLAFERRTVVVA